MAVKYSPFGILTILLQQANSSGSLVAFIITQRSRNDHHPEGRNAPPARAEKNGDADDGDKDDTTDGD